MDIIEGLNLAEGTNIAAYTFDAGANSHIITLSKHREKVLGALRPLVKSKEIVYIKTSPAGHGPKLLGKSASLIDLHKLAPKSNK